MEHVLLRATVLSNLNQSNEAHEASQHWKARFHGYGHWRNNAQRKEFKKQENKKRPNLATPVREMTLLK